MEYLIIIIVVIMENTKTLFWSLKIPTGTRKILRNLRTVWVRALKKVRQHCYRAKITVS